MDDRGEGISWMGNMVQKFEDLLSEVDSVMRQELTSVTNQLQTVGTNLVQFCLDVVEDKCHRLSENTEKERASDINVVDSDASKISIDEDHCEKELCNENGFLCSASVEPTDGIQFDPSVQQNVDTTVYEKSEAIGKGNLVKDKQSQHEMSLLVSVKEGKQHEMSDVVSPYQEERKYIDNAYSYISSSLPSSCSDYSYESITDAEVTFTVASTESSDDPTAQGILENVVTEPESDTLQSFHKVKLDESRLEEEDDLKHLNSILETLASARLQDVDTILEILASARLQESHISFLRQKKPHYSIMTTIMQNLDQIVKEEEKIVQNLKQIVQEEGKLRESLDTQELESCDSDWVIV